MLEENSSKSEEKDLSVEDTLEEKTKDLQPNLEEESLEEELDENSETLTDIKYSFDKEKFLMEQFYNKEQVKYEQSLYKQSRSSSFEPEEEYLAGEDEFYYAEAEVLTTEEAEETLVEIQYAAVLGTSNDVSYEKKRKFDLWIKFNSAMFGVFESTYALTRDVDYKPLA